MATIAKLNKIILDIENLAYDDKLNIMSWLVAMLKKSDAKKNCDISELKGLGKDIWKAHDVDDYINKERDSWD